MIWTEALVGSLSDALFSLRRSRLRDSRMFGSVGAKAEWLSYPPIAWPWPN